MSRVITDNNLQAWEAYASGGRFGLPERPKIIFNCISNQNERGRYVVFQGDAAEAEEAVGEMGDVDLLHLLATSRALD